MLKGKRQLCASHAVLQDPERRPPMSSVVAVLQALLANPHVAAQLDNLIGLHHM
jgi:hypothetical protein